MKDKQNIRRQYKARWKNEKISGKYYSELYSLKLANLLKGSKEYSQAKNIMLFYPMNHEINLLTLLDDKNKNFYFPRIQGKDLLCCPYEPGCELTQSCFNTLEPISEPVEKGLIDLVIVPALCCDKNNYRLGYGGGFYDRFLKDYTGKKICCIPKEFITETIYPESHDIPLDLVITC